MTQAERIGILVEGFGVKDHAHLHLVPLYGPGDLDMSLASEISETDMSTFAEEFLELWEKQDNQK